MRDDYNPKEVSFTPWQRERESARLAGREAYFDNPNPLASLPQVVERSAGKCSSYEMQWARGWMAEHVATKCSCGASTMLCDHIHDGKHIGSPFPSELSSKVDEL